MKNFLCLLIVSMFGAVLIGCSHGKNNLLNRNDSMVNEVLEKVLESIQKQNIDELAAYFSIECQSEKDKFKNSATELFNYYKGEMVTYDDWGGPIEKTTIEGEQFVQIMEATYDVSTTEEEYRIAIRYIAENTVNTNSVGIQSFYIIKKSDDINSKYAYRGDGKYTTGINIGIQNW